jgi:uncharacterized protein YgbK (DUF1537 family)
MTDRWLILADDLTGAADCAIAFGRRGQAAAVTWGEVSDASDHQLPVMAYDAASRGMSAADAAQRHADVLARLGEPGRTLFKKIDSTLRGQPAAETKAALDYLKTNIGAGFGVFAPAFPATGRTTIDGRILVKGSPLEEAEVWQRDHTYPNADLVDVLATAGIRGEKVTLATIRGGDLKSVFAKLAAEGDVVACCDAETDDDLHLIAESSLHASKATFFIGSAGLAHALAGLDDDAAGETLKIPTSEQGTLIVVGSLAGASRSAARKLEETGTVKHFPVMPETLLDANAPERAMLAADVSQHLTSGGDALVEIMMDDRPNRCIAVALRCQRHPSRRRNRAGRFARPYAWPTLRADRHQGWCLRLRDEPYPY